MATFNGQEFIAAQLNSLASQDYPIHELIVGDDGSTDDTIKIVREFSSTVSFPIRVVENKTRLGYSQNFANLVKMSDS